MPNVKNNNKKHTSWWTKRRVIVVAVVLLAWLTFDLSGIGSNIRFYSKWIECGVKPVVTNPEPQFGGGSIQYYDTAPTFAIMRLSHDYYCSPHDAELHGYSSNPNVYQADHLTQEEGEEVYYKYLDGQSPYSDPKHNKT